MHGRLRSGRARGRPRGVRHRAAALNGAPLEAETRSTHCGGNLAPDVLRTLGLQAVIPEFLARFIEALAGAHSLADDFFLRKDLFSGFEDF